GFAWVEHADEFEPEANNRQVRRATYGGGLEVIDVKVVKMDGTRSRLISTIGESAKYESASPAAASFYDSILDTLCFNDPIRVENRRGHPRLLDCSARVRRARRGSPRIHRQMEDPVSGGAMPYVNTFLSAECCR